METKACRTPEQVERALGTHYRRRAGQPDGCGLVRIPARAAPVEGREPPTGLRPGVNDGDKKRMKRYLLRADGVPVEEPWRGKTSAAAAQAANGRACVVASDRRLALVANGPMTRPQAEFVSERLVAGKALALVNLKPRRRNRRGC